MNKSTLAIVVSIIASASVHAAEALPSQHRLCTDRKS
ncbi:hypothetical protein, partial [Salmonella enterica]